MLENPISTINGVGGQTAEKLARLGVETIEELLYFFPRRYEDFSLITPIAKIQPGNVTLKARVESVTTRTVRRRLHITEAVLDDGTAKTRAVWFNQPYRTNQFRDGSVFYFSGTYDRQRNRYLLINPAAERVQDIPAHTGRIVPIYPETQGLKSAKIRAVVRELLPIMQLLPETLPPQLIARESLPGINQSLQEMHFPTSNQLLGRARERFAFEELLELMLAAKLAKQAQAALVSHAIPFDAPAARQFTARLPFALTSAQRRAAWELIQDIAQPTPMNRLLQGDVGSGKTVVAAMIAFLAAKAGYQSALMAPTELLAVQHAETLATLLKPHGITVGLLTGSLKPKAKKTLQKQVKAGEVAVVVGTHALIQKETGFHRLGLVVIDEQHRFGVGQRAELLAKGERQPHLLSMTATPIPRSLQLTIYGELTISVINELPHGRQPIITRVWSPYERTALYKEIDAELAKGHQAYIVCPVIEESQQEDLKSAELEYQQLKTKLFKHRRVSLLHGQLNAEEKERIMRAFKDGAIDVLVATSVVEVGVDVPNATVMLIEGAERFGLAQLHQLRGRVGRGQYQSYCHLMPSSGKQPSARLHELERSQDGFYLAEVDLKLRGPGELYGRMQHGKIPLKMARLTDTALIKRVERAAQTLVDSPEDLLQYEQLLNRVRRHRRLRTLN